MDITSIRYRVAEPDKSGGKSAIFVGTRGKRAGSGTATIALREDVSSIVFLHACSLPSQNSMAFFETWDDAGTTDLLGFYRIIY